MKGRERKNNKQKQAKMEKDCLLLEKTIVHNFLSQEDKQMMSLIFDLLKDKNLVKFYTNNSYVKIQSYCW